MKRTIIFLLSVLCTAATALAYDFQSSDLYYNITGENTVVVTYEYEKSSKNYQSLTTATIPATVTDNGTTYSVIGIGENAFYRCYSLTSISIPNSVTSIEQGAFKYCSGLISITIPNTVTSIGKDVFSDCSSLTSISIPNSVTSIGNRAFYNCSSLTSITIPNSVTYIGSSVFYGCSSLPVVDNLRYADTYLVEAVDESLSTYTIKAGTKWIGDNAFGDCSSLTSITIPNSVTSIGDWAFAGCSALTSITIPNSVTSIGDNAFYGCSSLTSIVWNAKNCASSSVSGHFATISANITSFTFGDEVERIPFKLCYGMSSLTSITIPNSVTSIGDWAFAGCSALTKTNYTGDIAGWCALQFDSETANPIYYSKNLFISGVEIKGSLILNSVTGIGQYTFYNCSTLTNVTLDNSVTSIGDCAFEGCSGLTSVTIGNSVTNIGNSVFNECSLADIYCYATTPPVCTNKTFNGVSKNCYIHVPTGTVRSYQLATGWSDFYYFFEISEETALPATEQDNQPSRKVLRNGQVLILRNGETYDMMGQRL